MVTLFLCCFSGEVKIFKATDSGDASKLTQFSSTPQKLYLKINAPVMLLVNLSTSLVNGLCGEVKAFGANYVEVFFSQMKKNVKIYSYNFTIFDKEKGRDIANSP